MASIVSAREKARQVREQISSEMWEQLNRLFHESRRLGTAQSWKAEPQELLHMVVHNSHEFQGVTDSTMIHGEGWHFIQAGRFMERVQSPARLIDVHCDEFLSDDREPVNASGHMEWIGLLRRCTAFEAYCKVHTAEMRPERVAEFLLMNPDFPHSVRFGVGELRRSLEAVHGLTSTRRSERLGKAAGGTNGGVRCAPSGEERGGPRGILLVVRPHRRQSQPGDDQAV